MSEVSAAQSKNALLPMCVTDDGIEMFDKFTQPAKAPSPIDTIVGGREIVIIDVQSLKALSSMAVKSAEMTSESGEPMVSQSC